MYNCHYHHNDATWASRLRSPASDFEQFIPRKKVGTRFNLPYWTPKTKRKIRKRQRVFKKARKYGRKNDWNHCKQLRKEINHELQLAFNDYINTILDPQDEKPGACKRFYTFTKSLRQESFGVGTLKAHGRVGATSLEKANMCNTQFHSAFSNEDTTRIPTPRGDPLPPMPNITISENGVLKLLKNIKPNKATGPDELPARVLRDCAHELAPAIASFFQQSLDERQSSRRLETATSSPDFQEGLSQWPWKLPTSRAHQHTVQDPRAHHIIQHQWPPRTPLLACMLPAWFPQVPIMRIPAADHHHWHLQHYGERRHHRRSGPWLQQGLWQGPPWTAHEETRTLWHTWGHATMDTPFLDREMPKSRHRWRGERRVWSDIRSAPRECPGPTAIYHVYKWHSHWAGSPDEDQAVCGRCPPLQAYRQLRGPRKAPEGPQLTCGMGRYLVYVLQH